MIWRQYVYPTIEDVKIGEILIGNKDIYPLFREPTGRYYVEIQLNDTDCFMREDVQRKLDDVAMELHYLQKYLEGKLGPYEERN